MNKLKNIILVFADGTEVSMESTKGISVNIATELPEPLLLDANEPTEIDFLKLWSQEKPHTTVTIEFSLSKVETKTAEYLSFLRR